MLGGDCLWDPQAMWQWGRETEAGGMLKHQEEDRGTESGERGTSAESLSGFPHHAFFHHTCSGLAISGFPLLFFEA